MSDGKVHRIYGDPTRERLQAVYPGWTWTGKRYAFTGTRGDRLVRVEERTSDSDGQDWYVSPIVERGEGELTLLSKWDGK